MTDRPRPPPPRGKPARATPPRLVADPDRVGRGIAMALLGFFLFVCTDTVLKELTQRYPVVQVLFMQASFTCLAMISIGVVTRAGRQMLPRRVSIHAVRAIFALGTGLGVLTGLARLPQADVYAIIFSAPLIVTALSVPMLREPVGWRRWSAVLVGFVGVLIMLAPGGGGFDWAAVAVLAAAFSYALSMLIVRREGPNEHPLAFGITGTGFQSVTMGAVLVVVGGVWPQPVDLAIAAGAGVLAALALLAVMGAYRSAPAAVVAPFQYTQMVWGVALGYLVFGDLPGPRTVVGSAIVVAAGLFILWRETVRRRALVGDGTPAPEASATIVAARRPPTGE